MEELSLSDYFAILRRWRRLFLIVTLTMAALSFVVALHWSTYRAIATVQIEQQEISAEATTPLGVNPRDAMVDLADQHVSELEQKVLSTSSLIEIITKFDLYPDARKNTPVADVAEGMRKKIKIELVSGDMANPAAANKVSADQLSAIAFTVSFDYKNALISQQVTDELVSRFLDQDLQERRSQSQETAAFLGTQIEALEKSMSDQEAKIADYQKEHGISRPESLAFNQQAAEQLTLNMQNLNSQIATNEGQIGSMRGELASLDPYSRVVTDGQVLTSSSIQLKALQSQYAALTGQYGPEHPDVVKLRHQIDALKAHVGGSHHGNGQLQAQIEDTRTNLDAARKTYGPDHPDVVALEHKLQNLEDELAKSPGGTSGTYIVPDADNPAYLQVVAELNSAEEQHKALLDQRKDMQVQLDKYQQAVQQNPEAEKQMEELSRDYENAQLRYRELKEKKMVADMDEQMQKDRKGGRLTLINPPELPLHTYPRRIVVLLAGLFLSFFCGSCSILVAQTLSQSVVGANHLEKIVGVAPLVAIPHISTRADKQHSPQQRLREYWIMFTGRLIRP